MKDIENMDTNLSTQEAGLILFMRQLVQAHDSGIVPPLSRLEIHSDYSGELARFSQDIRSEIFYFNDMNEANVKLQNYITEKSIERSK